VLDNYLDIDLDTDDEDLINEADVTSAVEPALPVTHSGDYIEDIDAVFYRWVCTLRHKYGSKIILRTSNVVLIL